MARQRRRAERLTTTRPGRRFRYENFTVGSRRFRGCIETEDEDLAEAIAAETKRRALLEGIGINEPSEISLKEAFARHWQEYGQHQRTARTQLIHARAILSGLGETTRLSQLNFDVLSKYVAGRRVSRLKGGKLGNRANGSVNREIAVLRAVVNACAAWGYKVPQIPWRSAKGPSLWLREPKNRQTLLPVELETAFFQALRPDFHGVVRFGLATGARRENVLGLRWDQVDWTAETVSFRVKSKDPDRKLVVVEMTARMRAILSAERGRHPEFVFTYLCQHGGRAKPGGPIRVPGRRYPFDLDGSNFERAWKRARLAIGLPRMRFHDLRHTFGTRLAAVAELQFVRDAMGHAHISTTERYSTVTRRQVRQAMERLEGAAPSQTPGRHQGVERDEKATGTSDS